jgi:hypothetical protein
MPVEEEEVDIRGREIPPGRFGNPPLVARNIRVPIPETRLVSVLPSARYAPRNSTRIERTFDYFVNPSEIRRLTRIDLARQSNGTMVNYSPTLNDYEISASTSPLQQNDRRYRESSFSNSDDSDSMSAEASLNNWDNLSLMQHSSNIYEDAIEEYDRTSGIPNSGDGAGAGGRSGLRAPPNDTPPRPKPQQKRNSVNDTIFPKRKASKKPLEWDTGTPERGRRQQTLDRYLTKKVRGKSS